MNEREDSKKTDTMDFNIFIGRIGECLEEKYTRRSRVRRLEVYINRRTLSSIKKGVRRRR